MVLFVQTSCSPLVYLVDAGGGTVGLVEPIPMYDGAIVQGASAPEEHRLVRTASISSIAEPSSNCKPAYDWRLEMRCGAHMPKWRVLFTFSTQPVDSTAIELANRLLMSPQGDTTFQNDIFCVKYFRLKSLEPRCGEEKRRPGRCDSAIEDLGRLVLTGNKATRRIGDKCEVVSTIKTELERRAVLNEVFGVKIESSEIHEELRLCSL